MIKSNVWVNQKMFIGLLTGIVSVIQNACH